ncbi:hypothetical protein J422_00320 [Methanocaldococcus villosus KIN24-T80]|uniref:Uncharacterized protein n=1 Tax=Methanocaldococcus villosus KIN24-T80 TaxID=1069083 RepID=N6VSJ8_9EURY|nr:hypothetical protein [Methanocaldococcus villosus]ENN96845.1 hypothetical protein J422_00320 [Methanocaldococcus villosus KIN24-T80]
MKKLLAIVILFTLLSLCINKNLDIYKDELTFYYNGHPIDVKLRVPISMALETELVNTSDKEIYYLYHTKKNLYIISNLSVSPKGGGVAILELLTKISWLNNFYPHNIILELNRSNNTVYLEFKLVNGKEGEAKLKINECEAIMNSNNTLVILANISDKKARISKVGNKIIIEGDSLEEMDKAVARFIIDIINYTVIGDIK